MERMKWQHVVLDSALSRISNMLIYQGNLFRGFLISFIFYLFNVELLHRKRKP